MAGRQRRVAAHGATQVALTDNAVAQLRLEPLTTADSPVVLQIIELLRYAADKFTADLIAEALPEGYQDCYDVILSDGRHKAKFVLSPKYNHLVQGHGLRALSVIKVTECIQQYDEEKIGAPVMIVLKAITVVEHASELKRQPRVAQVTYSAGVNRETVLSSPMASGRKMYLALWNDEDYPTDDTQWMPRELRPPGGIDYERLPTIKKVLQEAIAGQQKPRPIVGRVTGKSRLILYGSTADDHHYPVQAHVYLQDDSLERPVKVTLWTSACVNFYTSIQIEDILYIDNYKIGPLFGQRRDDGGNHAADDLTNRLEIKVNAKNPETILAKVKDIALEHRLPLRHWKFALAKQSGHVVEERNYDIAGVIFYLGREEREARTSKRGKHFQQFRWVQLRDFTAPDQPMWLKLYNISNPRVTSRLAVGDILVCTSVKCTVRPTSGDARGQVFFSTTIDSQVFVTSVQDGMCDDPIFRPGGVLGDVLKIGSLVEWRSGDDCEGLLECALFGGKLVFPPYPASLEAWNNRKDDINSMTMVSLLDLTKNLAYMERRMVVLQGCIQSLNLMCVGGRGARTQQATAHVKTETTQTTKVKAPITPIASRLRSKGSSQQLEEPKTKSSGQTKRKAATPAEEPERKSGRPRGKVPEIIIEDDEGKDTDARRGSDDRKPYENVVARGDVSPALNARHERTTTLSVWPEVLGEGDQGFQTLAEALGNSRMAAWVLTVDGLNRKGSVDVLLVPSLDSVRRQLRGEERFPASPYKTLLDALPQDAIPADLRGRLLRNDDWSAVSKDLTKHLASKKLVFVLEAYRASDVEVELCAVKVYPVNE